jgi:hypothetical protein
MGKSFSSAVGINLLLCAGLGIALAPLAGICREHIRQSTSRGRDPLQHGLQVLNGPGLVANSKRHDHQAIAADSQLTVVALDVVAV